MFLNGCVGKCPFLLAVTAPFSNVWPSSIDIPFASWILSGVESLHFLVKPSLVHFHLHRVSFPPLSGGASPLLA